MRKIGEDGVKVCKECNLLKNKYPDIFTMLDRESNRLAGIDIDSISYASHTKLYWNCGHGHIQLKSVDKRVRRGNKCIECDKLRQEYTTDSGSNLLKDTHPHIFNEIDSSYYTKEYLDELLYTSREKLKWVCEHKHKFEAKVYDRARRDTQCYQCMILDRSGLCGWSSNLLKDINPYLYEQLDIGKNENIGVNISTLTFMSHRKVWWKCKQGHTWRTSVGARSQGRGCAKCVGYYRISKIDLILHKCLTKYTNLGIEKEYKIKRYHIDNFINELNMCIEYDGSYWHNMNKENDNKKTTYLLSKGYKILKIVGEKSEVPVITHNNVEYIIWNEFTDSKSRSKMVQKVLGTIGFDVDYEDIRTYIESITISE